MWFLWAIIASLFAAVLAESNRVFRMEPQLLNAWRASFGALLIAMAFPLMAWPGFSETRDFYIIAGIDGIIEAFGMMLFLSLAARRTGRVTSMILPMAAIAAYATWWLIVPEERPVLLEKPLQVITAVFSLFAIILSLQKIRRNDNSWSGFLIVLPVGLAFGVSDALTKWVVNENGAGYGIAIAYSFLSICVCAVIAWMMALPIPSGGRKITFFDRKLVWCGFWCGFWTAGMYLALTFSLSSAPHPTYPGIIMALTPVWLYLYNQLRNVPDEASPIAGIIMILGAIGLLLSTL